MYLFYLAGCDIFSSVEHTAGTFLLEYGGTVVGKFLQQIDEGTLMLVYASCYVFDLLGWGQINVLCIILCIVLYCC